MKVLYVITSVLNGNGGHFYSLKTTVESLNNHIDASVLNIGYVKSEVISTLAVKNKFLNYNILNTPYIVYKFAQIVKKENIDIIHCFDSLSFYFARLLCFFLPTPIVVTKCGGKNPKHFYPFTHTLILFSQENFLYFKKKIKFLKTQIHLIPNRVSAFNTDESRIQSLKKKLGILNEEFIILKISRISNYYHKSLLQSINLTKELNKNQFKCRLLIIGNIIDQNSYDILKTLATENIHFITEPEFCSDSKELIDICNMYIGTGRGLMEAASKKKILFAATHNTKYPVLITKYNFDDLFNLNFSERYSSNTSDKQILDETFEMLLNPLLQIHYQNYSFELFEKHFSIITAIPMYIKIYTDAQKNYKKRRFKNTIDFFKLASFVNLHFILNTKLILKFKQNLIKWI